VLALLYGFLQLLLMIGQQGMDLVVGFVE